MMSCPGSPRTRMRPIGAGDAMRMAGSPRSTFIGGASVRSGRWPSRVWMMRMPARRAAARTSAQGPTAVLRREISLPSAAPKPPGSRKSRCISMMTSAIRPVSTASGSGSAAMVLTGKAASRCWFCSCASRAHKRARSGPFRPRRDRLARFCVPLARRRRSLTCENDVLHQRIDLVGPAVAAEHAVVPDPGLHMMLFEIGAQAGAEVVRGGGLADSADVVALAFDRKQHCTLDRPRFDRFALPLELAERQRTFLKDEANSLQVEFRRQVQHGEILIVERLRDLCLLKLALGEIVVQLAMRLHMALNI